MVELIQDFTDENRIKWDAILQSVQAQLKIVDEIEAQALTVPGHLKAPFNHVKARLQTQQRRCLSATVGRAIIAVQAPNEEMEFREIRENRATLDLVWKAVLG